MAALDPSLKLQLLLVERRVDLGHFLGLDSLVARSSFSVGRPPRSCRGRRASCTPSRADLLERSEQLLLGLGPGVGGQGHRLRRADVDHAVLLETRRGRNQLADDHVLLQPEEVVLLALDRGVGENLRRLLERCGREERLGRQRGLRDAEDDMLEGRRLAPASRGAAVLPLDQTRSASSPGRRSVSPGDPRDLFHHLAHDQLDVLVVDVDSLRA